MFYSYVLMQINQIYHNLRCAFFPPDSMLRTAVDELSEKSVACKCKYKGMLKVSTRVFMRYMKHKQEHQ